MNNTERLLGENRESSQVLPSPTPTNHHPSIFGPMEGSMHGGTRLLPGNTAKAFITSHVAPILPPRALSGHTKAPYPPSLIASLLTLPSDPLRPFPNTPKTNPPGRAAYAELEAGSHPIRRKLNTYQRAKEPTRVWIMFDEASLSIGQVCARFCPSFTTIQHPDSFIKIMTPLLGWVR